MNTVIKLIIIAFFLCGCNVVFGDCEPEDSMPYSKNDLPTEPHCSSKCCEFVIYEEAKMCFEMWCFSDCKWTMNHKACY